MSDRASEPIFNVPAIVVALLGLFAAVHLARDVMSEDSEEWLVLALAFIPARYGALGPLIPGAPWATWTSFLTHTIVHGDLMHLAVNSAWLLAAGTPIAKRLGALRFIVMFLVCGIAGALLFWAFNPQLRAPVVGASGAISGLMAGVLLLMFAADDPESRRRLRETPEIAPRLAIRAIPGNRPAVVAIAVWVLVNLVFAYVYSGTEAAPGGIAWEAHLGGFFAGLLLFGLIDRGPVAGSGPGGSDGDRSIV